MASDLQAAIALADRLGRSDLEVLKAIVDEALQYRSEDTCPAQASPRGSPFLAMPSELRELVFEYIAVEHLRSLRTEIDKIPLMNINLQLRVEFTKILHSHAVFRQVTIIKPDTDMGLGNRRGTLQRIIPLPAIQVRHNVQLNKAILSAGTRIGAFQFGCHYELHMLMRMEAHEALVKLQRNLHECGRYPKRRRGLPGSRRPDDCECSGDKLVGFVELGVVKARCNDECMVFSLPKAALKRFGLVEEEILSDGEQVMFGEDKDSAFVERLIHGVGGRVERLHLLDDGDDDF